MHQTFNIAGTITVDVGSLTLPGSITLGDLVKDSDGNARPVVLELLNSDDEVAFTWEVDISTTASTGTATDQTGAAAFSWTTGDFGLDQQGFKHQPTFKP